MRDQLSNFDMFTDAPAAPTPRPHMRRSTPLIAAVCSVVGLILVANAANPAVLSTLSTLEIFGAVVLAVFPSLTLLTLHLERKMRKPIEQVTPAQRTQTRCTQHDAHQRPARVHTRLLSDPSSEPTPHKHAS